MHYHRRPRWALPESAAVSEDVFLNRRQILAGLGFGAGALAFGMPRPAAALTPEEPWDPIPPLNPDYATPGEGRVLTDERISSRYNNFYEFGSSKRIWREAQALVTSPWTITIDGLVEEEKTIEFEDLLTHVQQEERVIRHRCVEAWSMVVPWVGFKLSDLIGYAAPLSSAKYVQFETFFDPEMASEQRARWWPWPYTEGLTMEEAAHPLSFMVTGAYGKVLHRQFGAPMRLHVPWKYGFKSIKSIRRITFTDERPLSFWEEALGAEYGFWANVNPEVPHRRWSQAEETDIGTGEKIPTVLYNGYAEEVAAMYAPLEAELGRRLFY
ncbi:MAG: protein-methionine-sulfoxide reductase catalytic subunit MsrP [Pseudomonadota bacterium]